MALLGHVVTMPHSKLLGDKTVINKMVAVYACVEVNTVLLG